MNAAPLIDGRWRMRVGRLGLDDLGVWRDAGTGEQVHIWLRFLSGRRLDILNPSPLDFEAEDVALGAAREPRWGGHTIGDHPYTVGQHLVEGVRLMRRRLPPTVITPRLEMRFLTHDASELLGMRDQLAPTKELMDRAWHYVDARLQASVHRKFGLSERTPRHEEHVVKRFDKIMAATEALQLAGYGPGEIGRPRHQGGLGLTEAPDPGIVLEPWPPARVHQEFLAELADIEARMKG